MTALSLTEARDAARDRMASATLGTDHHAEREAAKARAAKTFGSVLVSYLARAERDQRASSFSDTRRYLETHSRSLHSMPIADIRRADISALLGRIADGKDKPKPKPAPYASNRARAALSAYFARALGEGHVELNPVLGCNKAVSETARDRVLSDVELVAVWHSTDEPRDFDRIVRLLILTGQRREEVAGMRWSELDMAGAVWRLSPERTKNGRPHDIPLSAAALGIIVAVPIRADRDFVFGERAGGFSGFSKAKADLDSRIAETEAEGDIPREERINAWRIHDLRRTCSTGMNEIGVQPHIVEAVLNHISDSKAGVAGAYDRAAYSTEKRAALDAWAAYITHRVAS